VALDDFGTGYSSLAYLRRFPFDTLKVDRSFVREMMQRRDARAIVRMIASLGQTLHMRTVAEGVEDAVQAAVLRDYGCHAVQGYLVARPLPAAEVPTFLADWAARQGEALPAAPPTAPMPL
jgi:EAL domain-containing protein (putative c-di-GMP-specific phosphodiesterase class I)